jgi:hypothetical protein
MVLIRDGEDVGTLEGLGEVSEDVIDIKERFRGIGWASNVFQLRVS